MAPANFLPPFPTLKFWIFSVVVFTVFCQRNYPSLLLKGHRIPFSFGNGHEFAQIHLDRAILRVERDFRSETQVVHAA